MITVKQIAEKLADVGIPLVAGHEGTGRMVEYVTTIELNERTGRIQKDGFLLSTFHAFQGAREIVDHLEWLVEVGVSAVGFHTSVYSSIPDEVKQFADESGLPLFRLSAQTPYNLIFELFNGMRQDIRDKGRNRISQLNNLLIESILSGRSLRQIVEMIGEYAGGDYVAWIDPGLEVLEKWIGHNAGSGTAQSVSLILQSERERLQEARVLNEPCKIPADLLDGALVVFPISNEAGFGGYLAFHFMEEREAPEPEEMGQLIETASKILLSDPYYPGRRGQPEVIKMLKYFLAGGEDHQMGGTLPIAEGMEFHVVAVEAVDGESRALLERFGRWVELDADQAPDRYILFPPFVHDDRLILFMKTEFRIEQWAEAVPESRQWMIGVSDGASSTEPSVFRRLYGQSVISLNLCRKQNLSISKWTESGAGKVAVFLETQEPFKGFAEDLLLPLIQYDRQKNTDLVHTLRVYLDHFFNLKNTGEALFVHPNTVKYRMETIRELLPFEIEDASFFALLVLAYRSYGAPDVNSE
ncbi:PucR family transcriptional regulator [Edaphobacillus lindanitolerans]|uniref:Purine catabolism regulatory protein-like family protein n=1 Tax=Edaphobacillus lindanitolerans TaxID=550447 RepID=A0A1U7PL36_9BACI|nr:PucR family transcriptional regulator [Edaphobacillus lindanitolerans]SIT72845.1 Purine catabolism regulatory protein-like family protein [Edaphobacillus lindanitolerans]